MNTMPNTALTDKDDQDNPVSVSNKELEPGSDSQILSDIIKTSDEHDEVAEKEIKADLEEVKLSHPKPKIPTDVEDAGVKPVDVSVNDVIKLGSTIDIGITEQEYNKRLHEKIKGVVVDKVAFGISSVYGFALWISRMIKLAPRHVLKIVFSKGEKKDAD